MTTPSFVDIRDIRVRDASGVDRRVSMVYHGSELVWQGYRDLDTRYQWTYAGDYWFERDISASEGISGTTMRFNIKTGEKQIV